MNAGLADGTTTGDLVLQQAEIVPQTQHFFDFSHGQSLLGHSVSPLARGEIPIGCPAPLSAPTQKARSRNVNINSGSNPPLSSRFGLFTSPESLFTCPESLFTSSRNLYSHRPGIGIHMPRNMHTKLVRPLHSLWLTLYNLGEVVADMKRLPIRTFVNVPVLGHDIPRCWPNPSIYAMGMRWHEGSMSEELVRSCLQSVD